MINISDFDDFGLVDFFEKLNSTQLKVQVQILYYGYNSHLKTLGQSLGSLIDLKELEFDILSNTVIEASGYHLIMSSFEKLQNLTQLSINIESFCFFGGDEISIISNYLQTLLNLRILSFKVDKHNVISSLSVKYLIDTLGNLQNLESVQLDLVGLSIRSELDEAQENYWEGLSRLSEIQSLSLKLNQNNIGEKYLINLFNNILLLKKEKLIHFEIELIEVDSRIEWFDVMIQTLSVHINLEYLTIKFDNKSYLTSEQINKFCTFLPNLTQLKLLNVDCLNNTLISPLYFSVFSNALGQLKNLQFLHLSVINEVAKSKENQMILGSTLKGLDKMEELSLEIGEKNQRFYDELFFDLSESFQVMKALKVLSLNLKSFISEVACKQLGESLQYLNHIEKLTLKIYPPTSQQNKKKRYISILSGLKYLVSLKEIKLNSLIIASEDVTIQKELFQSLCHLQNLESLEFQEQDEEIFELSDIIGLSSCLQQLTQLQYLSLSVCLKNQLSQEESQYFQNSIGSLSNLRKLNLNFEFLENYNSDEYSNLIGNMKGLDKLTDFSLIIPKLSRKFIQRLSNSLSSLRGLQTFSFNSQFYLQSQDLMSILSNLAVAKNLKKLSLSIQCSIEKNETSNLVEACKNLSSLEELMITDFRDYSGDNLQFYISGIINLTNLKILELNCQNSFLTTETAETFMYCFKSTQKLENLTLSARIMKNFHAKGEMYLARGLLSLQRLRTLKLNLNDLLDKTTFLSLALAYMPSLSNVNLNYDFNFTKKPILMQPEEIEDFSNKLAELIQKKCILTNLCFQCKVDPKVTDELFDQQMSVHEFPYLTDLSFTINGTVNSEISLKRMTNSLQNLTNLKKLYLKFHRLHISQSTYQELSNSFKSLSQLEDLTYIQEDITEHDIYLFEGLENLVRLIKLQLTCTISMEGNLAFGKSLRKLQDLQSLDLNICKGGFVSKYDAIAIGNSLSYLQNMRKLNLRFTLTQTTINEEGAVSIAEGIQKMKKLQSLNIQINSNLNIQSLGGDKLVQCISDLGVLQELNLVITEKNEVSATMIDELVKAKSFKRLKKLNFQILQLNGHANLPIELADIFNENGSKSQLSFTVKSRILKIKQEDILIKINQLALSGNVGFLSNISSDIPVFINFKNPFMSRNEKISESTIEIIIEQIYLMKQTQLLLNVDKDLLGERTISSLCENIPKWTNVIHLNLSLYKNQCIDQIAFVKISENLSQLSQLKFLKLLIQQTDGLKITDYYMLINKLTRIIHLQELEISTGNLSFNKVISKRIHSKMKKLVNLNVFEERRKECNIF